MLNPEKQPLKQLLVHIERGEFQLAFETWSNFLRTTRQPCDHCPYPSPKVEHQCCACLEAKFRTLSLYKSGQTAVETQLLSAARNLNHHCTKL